MRRIYQVAAVVFFALGVFVVWESLKLKYFTELGPGAGFLPFWMGVGLVALSAAWFVQVSLGPVEPVGEDFVPERAGIVRIVAVLAALVLFVGLLDPLGFRVDMLGFMLVLLIGLGRQNAPISVALSLAGSFGLYHVFKGWLDVFLPNSSIELLQHLGL